ncbi:hypothetical protein [Maribacter sp. MAR_2009_72]|uniref:hypothetical protein n=1 Tax=Maribacter sp. MAR_2009_72 TaxID=1250050 RepID=UPI00119C3E15|nr:hypothetical protein [Maribacter sp. MAR_2009_72]TVZ16487.1 hypothetical protein JM81_2748 [Maribacter sp. MAR_2009_72]
MRLILIYLSIICFLVSCKQESTNSNLQKKNERTNFYDIYVHEITKRDKDIKLKLQNFDSLLEVNNLDKLLNTALKNNLIDSTMIKGANSKYPIKFSDSISTLFRKSKQKDKMAFSKPFVVDSNCVIFAQTDNSYGGVFEIIFMSKYNQTWKLDSTQILMNYRGSNFNNAYAPENQIIISPWRNLLLVPKHYIQLTSEQARRLR